MILVRWFKSLSTYRKVVLFLAGGMPTLVFDAFVAHYQWLNGTMKWNQKIPIIYGLLASIALAVIALVPLAHKTATRLGQITGAVGMLVGGLGIFFHASSILENIDSDTHGFTEVGKLLAAGAPIFAPAAFAGIGLLLLTLPAITAARHHHAQAQESAGGPAQAA